MALDKEYWKTLSFIEGHFPQIVCPTCNKGHLKLTTDRLIKEETEISKKDRESEDWEPYWLEYRFSAILKCSKAGCVEIVTSLGKGCVEENMVYDKIYGHWKSVYNEIYYPVYFYPSLNIISVEESYPNVLAEKLTSSFSHFFSDLASCANKIRVCIEILMDNLKIKKSEILGGKRKTLSLHKRISVYKTLNSTVADYLLAIKWIGNFGSHLDNLTKDDILDAYQLLDYSLKKIYDSETREITKLTKEINKRKAPRSSSKRKTKI